ncbi:MAG TPA: RNA methyltransferase [Pseudobdellovibrionaceae bacterium]|nr:RNA methyltransferase [Pseudobdellovibrionaceae bacterium]
MAPTHRARIRVVLHRPIYPRNIGMCARAVGNMGLRHMHIIAPRCDWTSSMVRHEASQGAAHAQHLLQAAHVHASLEEFYAQAGGGVRIGFTAREGMARRLEDFSGALRRRREDPTHPLWDLHTPIYLHFGTEDDGLSLEELEPMNLLVRLPSSADVPSFNLSHAVLLGAYELLRELSALPDAAQLAPEAGVNADERRLEHPRRAIREWLLALGFDLDDRRVSIESTLNRVLLGRCPSDEDVRLLEKVLFQTVEKLKARPASSEASAQSPAEDKS